MNVMLHFDANEDGYVWRTVSFGARRLPQTSWLPSRQNSPFPWLFYISVSVHEGIPTGNRGRGIYPPMRKRGDFSDQLFRCVERSRNWTLSPGEDHGDKGVGEGFASREIRFIDSSALMTRFLKK